MGATAAALLLAAPMPPLQAHSGRADGTRPFVTSVEPALPGVAASAVFAGDWQIHLSVVNGQTASVLDEVDRPFVRIGPNGVEGDHAAPAWHTSAVVPKLPGPARLPEGVGPDTTPDWRPVSRATSWSWFDPRIRSQPGVVTPGIVKAGVAARVSDFSIPLLVGDRPARINGFLEFEPPRGAYRHTLLSPARPAAGIEIGLLAGQAVPTLTVRNDSDDAVTVLGADREPFLRVGGSVEANLVSPTWMQTGRALGRAPKAVADPVAPPQWERIAEGHLVSWADYRSRPPDDEPRLAGVPSGGAVVVRHWTIPVLVGPQATEIKGMTEFEPFQPAGRQPRNTAGLAAALAGALLVGATAVVLLRRRGSRSPR